MGKKRKETNETERGGAGEWAQSSIGKQNQGGTEAKQGANTKAKKKKKKKKKKKGGGCKRRGA